MIKLEEIIHWLKYEREAYNIKINKWNFLKC